MDKKKEYEKKHNNKQYTKIYWKKNKNHHNIKRDIILHLKDYIM